MKLELLLEKLICPDCRQGKLEVVQSDQALCCTACGAQFPILDGVPALFCLEDLERFLEYNRSLQARRQAAKPRSRMSWGVYHWHVYGFSDLLPPSAQGDELLAFGCGAGDDRPLIEDMGFTVIGFDIHRSPGTDVLCDGHNLPFEGESFDVVLSSQVLEHLQEPWVAVAEIERVLRPAGVFVGSVAFLKPYHRSYFHMTYKGLQLLLASVGMKIDHVHAAQSVIWSILLEMLPLRFPTFVRRWCEVAENAYWELRGRLWALRNGADPKQEHPRFGDNPPLSYEQHHRLRFAPAVVFRARKVDSHLGRDFCGASAVCQSCRSA